MTTAVQAPGVMAPSSIKMPLWRQFGLMFNWQVRRSADMLVFYVIVQLLLSVATVIGYGLIIGDPPVEAARYLVTGAPTISLVMVGLVMTPQFVAQSRTEGSLDWMRALPISRPVFLLADLAVWALIALPGVILCVVIGVLRFDVPLSLSWTLLPAAALVALTAASIGYAIANLCPPALAQLLSQVFVFVVLLFSPLSYPASRLPGWAQTLHDVLPVESMGDLMRAGLMTDVFGAEVGVRQWAVVVGWCALSVAGAAWALGRRN